MMTPKAWCMKWITDKLDLLKLRTSTLRNTMSTEWADMSQSGRKYLQIFFKIFDKRLFSKIYKEHKAQQLENEQPAF